MSDRTDHPPSTDDGSTGGRSARRAVIGGIAGIALLVGPVALANVIVPGGDESDKVEAAADGQTSLVALRREAPVADLARARGQASMRTTTTLPPTTTTTAPPTTTTTEAPTTTTTEAPPPTEAPTPPPSNGGGFGDPGDYATWDALANCESGGNWSINTGNGYYGGIQFSLSTWRGIGGTGLPSDHSREVQIAMGKKLWETSGWGAWPGCTRKFGWR